jgi:hypothetical protein
MRHPGMAWNCRVKEGIKDDEALLFVIVKSNAS